MPGAQVSNVHGFLSSQTTGLAAHTPAAHRSPVVQASPSLQVLPSATAVCTHVPLTQFAVTQPLDVVQSVSIVHCDPHPAIGAKAHAPVCSAQLSAVHAFLSSHTVAAPVHAPLLQVSPVVHGLLSSHAPLNGVGWQSPVPAAHVLPRHVEALPHTLAVPAHVPLTHASSLVHRLPSSHGLPLLGAWLQAPVLA